VSADAGGECVSVATLQHSTPATPPEARNVAAVEWSVSARLGAHQRFTSALQLVDVRTRHLPSTCTGAARWDKVGHGVLRRSWPRLVVRRDTVAHLDGPHHASTGAAVVAVVSSHPHGGW